MKKISNKKFCFLWISRAILIYAIVFIMVRPSGCWSEGICDYDYTLKKEACHFATICNQNMIAYQTSRSIISLSLIFILLLVPTFLKKISKRWIIATIISFVIFTVIHQIINYLSQHF